MRRRAKLFVALLLVAASLSLVLWTTSAQTAPPALSVADAKYRTPGQEVVVRGNVVEGSILETEGRLMGFVVEDDRERLRVEYGETAPDNFGAKQVVVRGILDQDAEGLPVLRATAIQVGCASKY